MKHQPLIGAASGLTMLLLGSLATAQIAPPLVDAESDTTVKNTLTTKDKMTFLDLNRDGLISRKEADNSLLVDWKKWDTNNDGAIDTNEYIAGSKMDTDDGSPQKY